MRTMNKYLGNVKEIQFDNIDELIAIIDIEEGPAFSIGQYFLALNLNLPPTGLGKIIFPIQKINNQYLFTSISSHWKPNHSITLLGPFGTGFNIPEQVRKLSLISLGKGITKLIYLKHIFNGEIALFTDQSPRHLSKDIEINPLSAYIDTIHWAEFNAFETTPNNFTVMKEIMGIKKDQHIPQPSQIFLDSSMACVGLGKCGVCAIKSKKWLHVCKEGPVFDLNTSSSDWRLQKQN